MGTSINISKQLFRGVSYFFILTILYTCSGSKHLYLKYKSEDGSMLFKNKKTFFKDFAFCSCLTQSLKMDSVKYSENSIEAMYDLSDDELSIGGIGNKIEKFTINYINESLSNKGETYERRKLTILNCISFYKSKKLERYLDSLMRVKGD